MPASRIQSLWIAGASVLRCLPLLFAERPRTPLRVLCLMAFDTLCRLRTTRKLPYERLKLLAALMEFGASANAVLDGKAASSSELRATQKLLEEAGGGSLADEYWRRLQQMEQARPRPGSQPLPFPTARVYREEIAELSLGVLAAAALDFKSLDEGLLAIRTQSDLAMLFRIVMQCQVIDDVVDFSKDVAAGLPSFLTVAESLPLAFHLTDKASRRYANGTYLDQPERASVRLGREARGKPDASVFRLMTRWLRANASRRDVTVDSASRNEPALPFQLALVGVSAIALLAITLGRWRQRLPRLKLQVEPTFNR
jgi:hypothetical protein